MTSVLAALFAALTLLLGRPSGGGPRLRRVTSSGRARHAGVAGPVVLDLLAAVLAAGAPVGTALRLVEEGLDGYGAAEASLLADLARRHELAVPVSAGGTGPPWVQLLDRTLLLARDAGLAPAALLASAAADERRRRAARQRVAAARLGVRVVLPTGLCLLPAFVLLTVVPMVLALLGS